MRSGKSLNETLLQDILAMGTRGQIDEPDQVALGFAGGDQNQGLARA
jgi:hypothetical protein